MNRLCKNQPDCLLSQTQITNNRIYSTFETVDNTIWRNDLKFNVRLHVDLSALSISISETRIVSHDTHGNQEKYWNKITYPDHDRTRTCNPQIRSLVPYPLGHMVLELLPSHLLWLYLCALQHSVDVNQHCLPRQDIRVRWVVLRPILLKIRSLQPQ